MFQNAEQNNCLHIYAINTDYGSSHKGSANGPQAVFNSGINQRLKDVGLNPHWLWINGTSKDLKHAGSDLQAVYLTCQKLASNIKNTLSQNIPFIVIGGDHSCSIGTWKGAMTATQPLGLLWIDAHMDCHTPETSHTHAIHGMPLASLLGYGDTQLTQLAGAGTKLHPENVELVGVRSFEEEESSFIKKHKIKLHDMQEVRQTGLKKIIDETVERLQKKTGGFGISIDLDVIDPVDAPGVATPEPNGIKNRI